MVKIDKKWGFGIGIAILLLILVGSAFHWSGNKASGNGEKKLEFEVRAGDSPQKIIQELVQQGIIQNKMYFQFLLKITGNSVRMKAGLYELHNGMTAYTLMDTLTKGRVKMTQFTVPEGYNNRQIGDLLKEKKLVKSREDFLTSADNPELLKKFQIASKTSEGYLFPETYSVPYNYPSDKIAETMMKRFFLNLKKIQEAEKISREELHKTVILASIVEREAKRKEERPMMAGVFLRRMKIGMNLESCATIQYLFDKPKKRLFEKDLEKESPYNTYRNKGFPPGPISNPGMAALEAAFRPKDTGHLFFLRKPDGSHHFSNSIKEHLSAKKKYIDVLYD